MKNITWLHLSDWHQKGKDFDRDMVRDSLMEDIRNRTSINPCLEHIDFIAFSGDVAYHGKAEEYQTCINEFFNPVLEVSGLNVNKLFIVPGNHDLERAALELLPNDLMDKLSTSYKINEWLTNERKRRVLLTPMENYIEFVERYLGDSIKGIDPAYGCIYEVQKSDVKIAIIGLNSAWLSARNKEITNGEENINDYGHLILGESQIYESLKSIPDSDICIALLHHPSDWFTTTDKLSEKSLIRNRLSKACHFILHGHEHEPNVSIARSLVGDCITISAGSCYDRREPTASKYANNYNYVSLNLEDGEGTIFLRRYEDRQGWISDTATTGDETPGYCKFPFSNKLITKKKVITPSDKNSSKNGEIKNDKDEVLTRDQKMKLVNSLTETMTMSDRNTRDIVIDHLPNGIKNTIMRHSSAKADILNIVSRCLDFDNGIKSLIEAIRFFEGDSIGMKQVESLFNQIKYENA